MASKRGKGRPPHSELRGALLRCATEVLLEGGELSLREVARRAGVAPGAPYHHFPDKNALLLALAQDGFEALGGALSEAMRGEEDPGIRLRRMIETYLHFSVAHGAHYRLMFPREAGEPGSSWDVIAMAGFQRLAMAVAAVRTDLPPERVMATATTVWALCHGVVTLRLDGLLPDREPFPCLDDLVLRTNEAAVAIVRGAS